MPTGAKLAGGLLLAALAWLVSGLMVARLVDEPDPGLFMPINVVVGFLAGWRVLGPRVGRPGGATMAAAGQGLTAVVAATVAAWALHASVEMVRQSLRKRYDGPVEATVAVFEIMLDQGRYLAAPEVVAALLGGGVVAGLAAEWTGRRVR